MKGTEKQVAYATKMTDSLLNWGRSKADKSRDGAGNNTLAQIADRLDTEGNRLARKLVRMEEIGKGTSMPSEKEKEDGIVKPSPGHERIQFQNKERSYGKQLAQKRADATSLREAEDKLRNLSDHVFASDVIDMCKQIDNNLREHLYSDVRVTLPTKQKHQSVDNVIKQEKAAYKQKEREGVEM